MRRRTGLRVASAGVALVALATAVVPLVDGSVTGGPRLQYGIVAAIYLVIGILIIERRPGNRVGPIVWLLGVVVTWYLVADSYSHRSNVVRPDVAAWSVDELDGIFFLLLTLLFLLFPDGRLPSPRWRSLIALDGVLAVIVVVGNAVKPGPLLYYPAFTNPFAFESATIQTVTDIAYRLMLLVVAIATLSLIGRWREGGAVERAQLKWVALSAILIAVVMAMYTVFFGRGYNEIADTVLSFALGLFPVAIGIAILRYHLFEIDRIVSRTIAYVLITAVLVGLYAAAILVLQGPLSLITGGETIGVALSTLAVAALFQPVRRRVQALVDRRFDRSRVDAERTALAFSARLRGEVDIEAVSIDLRRTAAAAVRPETVTLWIRRAD